MPQPRKIEKDEVFEFEFSLCTLITNKDEYGEMRESFYEARFHNRCLRIFIHR